MPKNGGLVVFVIFWKTVLKISHIFWPVWNLQYSASQIGLQLLEEDL